MKKRLIIICEGQTEANFINQVLFPYLHEKLEIEAILVKTGENPSGGDAKGGALTYARYSNEVCNLISRLDGNRLFITSFIDLYALDSSFPGFNESLRIQNPKQRVEFIESKVFESCTKKYKLLYNFIPFIMLHEYETLLFTDIQQLDWEFMEDEDEAKIISLVEQAASFNSPEEINYGTKTAPSKRIIAQFPNYERLKKTVGVAMAERIGLTAMRQKCPHFNDWLSRLETL